MWSSRRTASLGAAAALVVAAAASAPSRRAPAAAIRPSVALVFAIESDRYRRFLGDSLCTAVCDSIRAALDSVARSVARSQFPFLEWTNGAAAYTAQIRLVDDTVKNAPGVMVHFHIAAAPPASTPMRDSVFPVRFEEFSAVALRENWSRSAVTAAWKTLLQRILRSDEVFSSVFGRIPLAVTATIQPDASPLATGFAADVRIRPADVGSAPNGPATFRLTAKVTAGGASGWSDLADLVLRPCPSSPSDAAVRRCRISLMFLYTSRDTLYDDRLRDVLSRAALDPAQPGVQVALPFIPDARNAGMIFGSDTSRTPP